MRFIKQPVGLAIMCVWGMLSAAQCYAGDKGLVWGQEPPDSTPRKFAPGIVSTGDHEYACSFSLDGKSMYFTRNGDAGQAILVVEDKGSKISDPVVAPFSGGETGDFEAHITPDGKKVIFQSWRPLPAGIVGQTPDMWYSMREDQGWGNAQHFGPPFKGRTYMYSSTSNSGTLYSAIMMDGTIVKSEYRDGKYGEFEELGSPINTEHSEQYPSIAPDGSYLLFNSDRPVSGTSSNLFISFKNKDGSWGEPQMIETGIAPSNMAVITRDGKYMFFISYGEVYWVSTSIIDKLRPTDSQ